MFEKLVKIAVRLSDLADRCAKLICWPTAGALFLLILMEITLRYVFSFSVGWSNDVIRLCFTWSVLISFSIALKASSHIEFSFVTDRLPHAIRGYVALFGYLVCICFFVYVTVEGFQHFQGSANAKFLVLDLSKQWYVLPLPLTGLFMTLHSVAMLLEKSCFLFSPDQSTD